MIKSVPFVLTADQHKNDNNYLKPSEDFHKELVQLF